MSQDHIVDEVRAIRDSIAREHGYSVDAIFEMLQASAAKSAREHVSPAPPPVEVIAKAAQLRVELDGAQKDSGEQ